MKMRKSLIRKGRFLYQKQTAHRCRLQRSESCYGTPALVIKKGCPERQPVGDLFNIVLVQKFFDLSLNGAFKGTHIALDNGTVFTLLLYGEGKALEHDTT